MLYRKIIAVCSQIHTKHINTLCGQNVELLNVKLAVHNIRVLQQAIKCTFSFSKSYYIKTLKAKFFVITYFN
jgi:hypothetical protein